MKCIVYNRISSNRQNSLNSVSLKVQETICNDFANNNKLNIKNIYKEVHSAYNKAPTILNDIVKLNKRIILIPDVSRFSRSVIIGLYMAETAVKNKNQLIFIKEHLVCKELNDFIILKQFLQKTEYESKILSDRIINSKKYLTNNNMFAGGYIPYGYNVVNKKIECDAYEQQILQFIKLCHTKTISYNNINTLMMNISKLNVYEPINCYDVNDEVISNIVEPLNNKEISDLLNSYNVLKRAKSWTPALVKSAIYSNNSHTNKKRKNINDTEINPCKFNKINNFMFRFNEMKPEVYNYQESKV